MVPGRGLSLKRHTEEQLLKRLLIREMSVPTELLITADTRSVMHHIIHTGKTEEPTNHCTFTTSQLDGTMLEDITLLSMVEFIMMATVTIFITESMATTKTQEMQLS